MFINNTIIIKYIENNYCGYLSETSYTPIGRFVLKNYVCIALVVQKHLTN